MRNRNEGARAWPLDGDARFRPVPDDPARAPPRAWRIARNIVLAVIALIVAIWLVLYITKGRFLRASFERFVGGQTHRAVRIDGDFQLYFAPFKIKFVAERMTIANPAWASRPYLFDAARIDTRIAPLSLLWGKRRLYWLDLVDGKVDLEWKPDHSTNTWTFSDKKGGKPLDFPRIDVANVRGTTVRYVDPRMQVTADLAIADIRSTDARIGKSVGVTGTGRIRTAPFTLTARLLTPDATVNRGQNQLVARMRAAGNVIDVAGTLPSLAEIERVPLSVAARGRNMADLLGIIGVAIPNTRTYRVRGQMVKDGADYRFTRLTGVAGATDLAGTLTVTTGERLHLDSTLATKRLDIIDAAPFIGYNPDIVATKGAEARRRRPGRRAAGCCPMPRCRSRRCSASMPT